jgi:hypothetical protein
MSGCWHCNDTNLCNCSVCGLVFGVEVAPGPCQWCKARAEKAAAAAAAEPPRPKLNPREVGIAPGAFCGNYSCGGCYEVDGATIHPPRPGYRQQDLIDLDEDSQ